MREYYRMVDKLAGCGSHGKSFEGGITNGERHFICFALFFGCLLILYFRKDVVGFLCLCFGEIVSFYIFIDSKFKYRDLVFSSTLFFKQMITM